jgi:UPF0716 protein FxsA
MWLFALFVAVPMIEIALFIQVGGLIGLWPTLAIVVLTAVLGTALVRHEGMRALSDLRRSFETLSDPGTPLAHGAMILLAGALLLTPGFFTDTIGFILLVPAARKAVMRWIAARVRVERFSYGSDYDRPPPSRPMPPGDIIEGEFEEAADGPAPTHRPSGWTRH